MICESLLCFVDLYLSDIFSGVPIVRSQIMKDNIDL